MPRIVACNIRRAIIINQQGQALLLVIILMMVLAVVVSIFIALVIHNTVQTTRHTDLIDAQHLAEAGIRFANDQLINSDQGAHWRPIGPTETFRNLQDFSKQPIHFTVHPSGRGRFLLWVEYQPTDPIPLSKFIRIIAIGRITNKPYVYRLLVAYKPIAITDYARFITNRNKSTRPAELGAPWIDLDGDGYFASINTPEDWTSYYNGPIRANADLIWHGKNYINLFYDAIDPLTGLRRYDTVEIAGKIFHRDRDDPAQPINYKLGQVQVSINGAGPVDLYESDPRLPGDPLFTTRGGLYRDAIETVDVDGYNRWITRLEPPELNLQHYRHLTDTNNNTICDPQNGDLGIYIDNLEDIQFKQFDDRLDRLRNEWLRIPDEFGQLGTWVYNKYAPIGVEILLTNEDSNLDGLPEVIITRHDKAWPPGTGGIFIDQWTRRFNYLALPIGTGVIFAEGNVRIRGTLPTPTDPDGAGPLTPLQDYRYNLTVVSGGTIYIEGNLLAPEYVDPLDPSLRNKFHLALLAQDAVCLNTSTLTVAPTTGAESNGFIPPNHWLIHPADPPYRWVYGWINFGIAPTNIPYLTCRHSGYFAGDTAINIWINTAQLDFDPDPAGIQLAYMFSSGFTTPLQPWQSNIVSPEFETRSWNIQNYLLSDPATGGILPGANNIIAFAPDITAQTDYWLSTFKIEQFLYNDIAARWEWQAQPGMTITIDALIYAQNGSWFVIPGDWFDPANPTDSTAICPTCMRTLTLPMAVCPQCSTDLSNAQIIPRWVRCRYNYHININGAISENYTTDIPAAIDWTNKWCYPNGAINTWSSITYNYDSLLHTHRTEFVTFCQDCQTTTPGIQATCPNCLSTNVDILTFYRPKLPHLPVSPDLIYFGELL